MNEKLITTEKMDWYPPMFNSYDSDFDSSNDSLYIDSRWDFDLKAKLNTIAIVHDKVGSCR